MSNIPKYRSRFTRGSLDYEIIVHSAVAESSIAHSHVQVELLKAMIDDTDLSFWAKFENELSMEDFFAEMLKALARGWVNDHWLHDELEPNTLPLHRALDDMLLHLKRTGHLPETIEDPREDDEDL